MCNEIQMAAGAGLFDLVISNSIYNNVLIAFSLLAAEFEPRSQSACRSAWRTSADADAAEYQTKRSFRRSSGRLCSTLCAHRPRSPHFARKRAENCTCHDLSRRTNKAGTRLHKNVSIPILFLFDFIDVSLLLLSCAAFVKCCL